MSTWKQLSTRERIDLLIAHHHHGDSSANQLAERISDDLGERVTRNAVVGMYSRYPDLKLSIPLSGVSKRPMRSPPREKMAKPRPVMKPLPEPAPIVHEVASRELELTDLGRTDCRWTSDTDAPFRFCGHPVKAKSAYCPFHHRIVYVPPPPKKRR